MTFNIEPIVDTILEVLDQQWKVGTYVDFLCGMCAREAGVGMPDDGANPGRVYDLVEHVMFDHVTRADIQVQVTSQLILSYEVALVAGLDARTEHEVKWREEQAAKLVE